MFRAVDLRVPVRVSPLTHPSPINADIARLGIAFLSVIFWRVKKRWLVKACYPFEFSWFKFPYIQPAKPVNCIFDFFNTILSDLFTYLLTRESQDVPTF